MVETNKKLMKDPTILDFKSLKILIANKDDILNWSYGEVTKPETINYRTLRPEKDGLFDERIFGPTKDWECYCGKYKRIRYRGIICDKCGVEVTLSRVRRERIGQINLASPIAHVWFFKGSSSPLSLLLDVSQKNLESVIYYASYLVVGIDEEKKKEALDIFTQTIEGRKDGLKQKMTDEQTKIDSEVSERKGEAKEQHIAKEQRQLIGEELELSKRQRIARLQENFESESKKLDEISDTLLKLLKSLKEGSVLSEDEYYKLLEYEIPIFFTVKTGSEALLQLVESLDLDELIASLRKETEKSSGQKYLKFIKRLRLIESMRKAGVKPASMILEILPVIPPDLRPMVQLAGGRFATSDLNDLYRRVINRNNRLKHLIALGAPEIILRNEKRMLQEAVDALIDASQRGSTAVTSMPLKSLSDMLRGKQGRFRQNLLGKRVDYSGRSVIVVGPNLSLSECGLPKEMALEMFKPFVLREVITKGLATNIKSAKRYIEKRPPEVFDILEEITKNHPVLLNRAPTLHKLGIQAFFPVLIEGSAIQLHPCVCAGYNADFDGDQMAVHIPLSQKAQEEAIRLMMPKNNLLKPADGSPITLPNKEMALGVFYLTSMDQTLRRPEEQMPVFEDMTAAIMARDIDTIKLREPIRVRIATGADTTEVVETTVGRLLFNELLPAGFGYLNDAIPASGIKKIITRVMKTHDADQVAALIDSIKNIGFYGATISGISISAFDSTIIPEKNGMIHEAEKKVTAIDEEYQQGLITLDEKKRLANDVWIKTTEQIATKTWNSMDDNSPMRVTINSGGSRAGIEQLKQLSAMRGLIVDPLGKIVELPIKSNFREGLSIFEYVASARGARKGLTDSALKTANAGYLTRRLVDVAHDVIIHQEDCGTTEGISVVADAKDRTAAFTDRLIGRVVASDIVGKGKKVLFAAGEMLTDENVHVLTEHEIKEVMVRSPFACKLSYGLCQNCYGWDFSTRQKVNIGVPIGVIAAQSIGEPGTQLTMRVRHFGGVVMADVTQGLPRVEELFEMRTPKNLALISEITGKVKVQTGEDGFRLQVRNTRIKPVEVQEYFVPLSASLTVQDGDEIVAGTPFAEGYLDPKEVLKIGGLSQAQFYVLTETQKVYESQGIAINDKHFEVILRKMSDKVIVETVGDSSFIPGDYVSKARFEEINAEILSAGGEPATGRQIVLGITKAALYSDSWLSASSFQQTTTVLTEAALEGREDRLRGLKENVIIGRLIPVEASEFVEA